jgi:lipoprotein-anchoring transpeptidase ErfK/SrfK
MMLVYVISGMVMLGFFAIVGLVALLILVYAAQPRIASGVSVAGIDIGNEINDEAAQTLASAFTSKQVMVTDGVQNLPVALSKLGVSLNVEATMSAAENAPSNAIVQPVYQVDFERAHVGLMEIGQVVNIDPVAGNPPQTGVMIDIPFVLDRLRIDATGELVDGVLDLNMIEVEGEYLADARYTGPATSYVVQTGDELGLISRRFGVTINDIMEVNDIADPNLLYIGQTLSIPAPGQYTPTQDEAPSAPLQTGKSIVVSTESQRIYAYENGRLVKSYLVSTGLPATPTVKGEFKIYVKYLADDMQGADYFLPQVPYTMYYYRGYAIHGTYWHNKFGRPMSHGCVNLPPEHAQWFFEWAEVGTLVKVI